MSNDTNLEPQPAIFVSNSESVILQNQSDYMGSIIRLSINQNLIPIFIFKVEEPVNNINLGIYSFTLTYDNYTSGQIFLIWQTSCNLYPPSNNTPRQVISNNYYYCYSYQTMIDCMNVALKTAYINLSNNINDDNTTLPIANYPYFIYNTGFQLLELHASTKFDLNSENPVNIYCNTFLSKFIRGFKLLTQSYTDTNGLNYQLVVKTLPDATKATNLSNDYITMYQEASCLSYWNSLRQVYVKSDMSVVLEGFYDPNTNITYNNILTDFIPDLSGQAEALICEKQISYDASSLYRFFEFNANNDPLRSISLTLVWGDNYGNEYPIYLDIGFKCDIKIMFIKKSFLNNINILQRLLK
jgi:hypothetical protein